MCDDRIGYADTVCFLKALNFALRFVCIFDCLITFY